MKNGETLQRVMQWKVLLLNQIPATCLQLQSHQSWLKLDEFG